MSQPALSDENGIECHDGNGSAGDEKWLQLMGPDI